MVHAECPISGSCCIMFCSMSKILEVPRIGVRKRIDDEVILEIANQIVERFHPDKIMLFGSYAYGTLRIRCTISGDEPLHQSSTLH